ncbi:envelope stress response membrane protein PspC [Aestuariibacter salexigens]|uniref:envelope stress response membrane protein PspC n=1 Tax=Aestuariibacter salexigens TaxID=226010 RepID=UPI000410FD6E|nr:envelope stress response membrane protein PspC [Aestuariibacter salexigens]
MSERKTLYRDPSRARIAGVCAGVAEYFGLEVWLVRILTVTGFFLLAGPFVLVTYVAAWFILDKKPGAHKTSFANHGRPKASMVDASDDADDDDRRVEVKARVWQAGEPPKQAFMDIKHRYNTIERRLRKLETYVTSKEYQLNREISKL